MATRDVVFSDLKNKFYNWLSGMGVDPAGAGKHYRDNLEAIGEAPQEHTSPSGKWFGLYNALTGETPKPIYSVTGVADFAQNYGKAVRFFTVAKSFEGSRNTIRAFYPNATDFDQLYDFAYTNGDNGHTRNGFSRYLQFLYELESQVDVVLPAPPTAVTCLDESLQQIVYGAPGTGKSKGVNDTTSMQPKENVIRTTFHPDSDYSTFVGAYKPTMVRELAEQENKHLGIDQLADILKREYDAAGEGSDKGKTLAVDLFAEQYYEYLDGRFGKVSLEELLSKAEMPQGYNVCLRDSINVAKYHAWEKVGKKHISYEFVPRAFAKAYVQAWKRMAKPEVDGKAAPVLLIIEEINRGNCAQIFGDLFQLLDRHAKGFSEYPVLADSDLADYIRGALTDAEKTRIKENGYGNVVADENLELMLPPNMYIWATMNTSDQSLFPIDSAFKRRWDWKYVPIVEPDKSGDPDWRRRAIKVKDRYYDWWTFLTIINHFIETTTKSEDKQLGYFFVKAPDATGIITADQFVNKVLFYLFGDVFKDWKLPEAVFGKGDGKFYSFRDFFGKKVDEINEDAVVKFLEKMEWKDDQNTIWKMEPSNTAPQTNVDQATSKVTEPGDGPAVDGTAGAGAQNDAEPVAE